MESMRLTDGSLWPIPVVLDVSYEFTERVSPGDTVDLLDPEGVRLADRKGL